MDLQTQIDLFNREAEVFSKEVYKDIRKPYLSWSSPKEIEKEFKRLSAEILTRPNIVSLERGGLRVSIEGGFLEWSVVLTSMDISMFPEYTESLEN